MANEYKIISYYSEPDHAYIAFAPDLPGCFADGETIEEARENIAIVIEEWKVAATELGRDIPQPLKELETSGATVFDVAKYVLTKTGTISTMTLQKLVYYCQSWALGWFHKPLFAQDFQAWENGPVSYPLFKSHQGKAVVSSRDIISSHELSVTERQLIDDVLAVYGDEDARWLSNLTHHERPWDETRGNLPPEAGSSRKIEQSLMEDYYGGLV